MKNKGYTTNGKRENPMATPLLSKPFSFATLANARAGAYCAEQEAAQAELRSEPATP